jgi:iron complex outermembrane recepter protein
MTLSLAVLFLAAAPLAAPETKPSPSPSPGDVPRREETVDVEAELPVLPPSASAATRLPVPVESLPIAVSVVPRSLFREQDAFVMSDARKNASGANTVPAFGVFDYFVIRGFDSLTSGLVAVDGAPEPESTFYPLYNVRQIEVLKGPGGYLYGGNPLASVVNLVRKQPSGGRFAEASATYGSLGTYAAAVDGNAARADGSLAFRLNGVWQGSDGYRDDKEGSQRALHPVLVWKPDAASRVGLGFEYVKSEASPDTGIPFVGDDLAPVPRTQSYQSSLDRSDQDIYRVRLDAERRLGSSVTLRNKLYYTDLEWDSDGTLVLGAFPTPVGSIVPRILAILDDRQKVFGDQLEASVTFKTGGVSHVFLGGVEAYRWTDVFQQDAAFLQPVDLLNPVDRTQAPVATDPAFQQKGDSRSLVFAPYLVDRLTLGSKFGLFVGGRLDTLDYDDDATNTQRDATKFSPLGGLSFAPNARVSLYVNAGSAFAPPSTQVVGPRDPETSRQIEAGVKTTFSGGKGYAAAAVYDLERKNIAIPDSTGLTRQSGDQRSRGFELDLSVEPVRGWITYASYAFTDAELKRFAELVQLPQPPFFTVIDRSGNRPPFAPRHIGSLWTSKTFAKRLTLAAGARFVSDQFVGEDNQFRIDNYATLDAAASYRTGRARFSLNLKNLTGTEYETRGFGAASAVPAPGFEVRGRIEIALGQ